MLREERQREETGRKGERVWGGGHQECQEVVVQGLDPIINVFVDLIRKPELKAQTKALRAAEDREWAGGPIERKQHRKNATEAKGEGEHRKLHCNGRREGNDGMRGKRRRKE